MSNLYASVKITLMNRIIEIDDEYDSLVKQRDAANERLDRIGGEMAKLREVRDSYSDALDLLEDQMDPAITA